MYTISSLCLGYFIGCIHPAALLSRRKAVDLKHAGTGNLGATNTAIVMGRGSGILVMVLDILKSFFAARLAARLFPRLAVAGLVASIGTMLGHCFPVFLHFQGGKGLAAYGGMVLSYSIPISMAILLPGVLLILLLNTGVALPIYASLAFPVLVWLHGGTWQELLCAALAGGFLFVMHWSNLQKAIHNRDVISARSFLKRVLFKRKEK